MGEVPVVAARRAGVRTLIVLSLLVATSFAMFGLLYDPYREFEAQPIERESFEEPGKSHSGIPESGPWHFAGSSVEWVRGGGHDGSGGVRLEVRESRGSFFERTLENPHAHQALRVRGKLRIAEFEPRPKGYSGARWVLFFRDEEGHAMWQHPHVVCRETEARRGQWIACEETFDVPPEAVSGHVRAQIVARSGALLVDDLEIVPAEPREITPYLVGALFVLWLATSVQALLVLRLWSRALGWTQLLLSVVIVAGTACPSWVLQEFVDSVREATARLADPAPADDPEPKDPPPASEQAKPAPERSSPAPKHPPLEQPPELPAVETPEERPGPLRRLATRVHDALLENDSIAWAKTTGHAVLFFVLALVSYVGLLREQGGRFGSRWLTRTAWLAGFAAATELLQLLVPTRGPSTSDWLLDLAGILVALALCAAARGAARIRRFASRERTV